MNRFPEHSIKESSKKEGDLQHGRHLHTNLPELLQVILGDLVGMERHETNGATAIFEVINQLHKRRSE